MTLFDAAGRKVIDLHTGQNDLRKVLPGVYFIKTENMTKISKILIIR
jgi:hypothetical protein